MSYASKVLNPNWGVKGAFKRQILEERIKFKAKGKSNLIEVQEDGVYVDVSSKNNRDFILGFVIVSNGIIESCFSIRGTKRSSTGSEREACKIAKELYPDSKIFCDCKEVCASTCSTYIHRNRNQAAHAVARHSINLRQ